MPFKNATSEELLSYEQVKGLPEYAGILSDDTILVDVDDMDQSMALLTIIETLGLKCRVYSVLIFASTFYNDFCGFDRKIHFRRFTR